MSQSRIKKRNPKEARQKKKLAAESKMTNAQVRAAMLEASRAIDTLSGEVGSLKRIIIAERAQVIYYTERALAFARRETLDVELVNFADLPDEKKEKYVKQAIEELGSDEGIVPHGGVITTDAPAKKGPKLIIQ